MSSDFQKVLVRDDRLNVSDTVKYAVQKGGQNMTPAVFQAVSQTTSSHTYNIQVPSEQTIIDRRVLWRSTVVLKIDGTPPAGQYMIDYALNDALAPFPLHQMCSVMTATINNNSVSINMRDVLASILRFNDRRELQRYNGYTPVAFDTIANYNDIVSGVANPLGGWQNNADNDLLPRGSWTLLGVSTDPNFTAGNDPVAGSSASVYVKFSVAEPLLLSPFIFAHPKSNSQGFYGVQNMNFVFNIGSGSRVWRSTSWVGVAPNLQKTCTIYSFTNSELVFNFLTPHPSMLIPARNVVPYYELPRYITSNLTPFTPSGTVGDRQTLRTSNIQLNQVPDRLIVFVRKQIGLQTVNDPDFFLTINGLSINFNNQSGILASATQQDLYRYSVENSSNQSWAEFSGSATIHTGSAIPTGVVIPTAGSMVVLEFGKDIQLVEDFYAPGSLGNFNLQIVLDCTNQTSQTINAEIVLITMNSGVFVNERGTSSTYTGILTKQDVLDASSQEAYTRSDVDRLVGGGFLDSLKSVAGKLVPKLPSVAKGVLGMVDNKYAKAGADVLGALGYAKPKGKLADRIM